tara:strand:- start:74 stop:259 length:186 start_codon:yes stop_codon:yes gene_type:complete
MPVGLELIFEAQGLGTNILYRGRHHRHWHSSSANVECVSSIYYMLDFFDTFYDLFDFEFSV